jgi:hypothetical protein
MAARWSEIQSVFDVALGIRPPWRLERTSLNHKEGRLRVDLNFCQSVEETCPLCGIGRTSLSNSRQKVWRHLNFFQYETYVAVQIPQLLCNNVCCTAHSQTETVTNTLFLDVLLMVSPYDIKNALGTLLTSASRTRSK